MPLMNPQHLVKALTHTQEKSEYMAYKNFVLVLRNLVCWWKYGHPHGPGLFLTCVILPYSYPEGFTFLSLLSNTISFELLQLLGSSLVKSGPSEYRRTVLSTVDSLVGLSCSQIRSTYWGPKFGVQTRCWLNILISPSHLILSDKKWGCRRDEWKWGEWIASSERAASVSWPWSAGEHLHLEMGNPVTPGGARSWDRPGSVFLLLYAFCPLAKQFGMPESSNSWDW